MKSKSLVFFILALLFPLSARAATVTVSPGQSIQNAVNTANPGDSIQVRTGTYPSFTVSKNNLIISGYPGEKPVLSGGGGVKLSGSDITLSNFEVTAMSANQSGAVLSTGNNNIIKNNIVRDNTAAGTNGILIMGANNQVLSNVAYNNNKFGIGIYGSAATGNIVSQNTTYKNTLSTGDSDGIHCSGDSHDNTFSENTAYENSDDGLDTWSCTNNLVTKNVSHHNGGTGDGHGIKLGYGGGNTVTHNISYSNRACGFTGNGSGNRYENNTAHSNAQCGFTDAYRVPGNTKTSSFINNVAYNNPTNYLKGQYTAVFTGNSENIPSQASPGLPTGLPTEVPLSGTKAGAPAKAGDANGDGQVDGVDYVIWLNNYNRQATGAGSGDFDNSGKVDGLDYVIWLNNYGSTGPGNKTPTPNPSLPQPQSNGIWISAEEIKNLPISGQTGCTPATLCFAAWNAILAKADSSWGIPNLSDYSGLEHSQGVWAGALAAARLSTEPGRSADAQKYRNKTLTALNDVMGTEAPALPSSGGGKHDGSLAIARQFPRYVLAADLLGITGWGTNYQGYKNFPDYMLHAKFTFRVGDGGTSLSVEAGKCASNGCAMAQAARIAAAAYLKDTAQLDDAWLAFRKYSGDSSSPATIEFSSTGGNWYHDNSAKMAINPKGTACTGSNYPADGVIPNDQGRGGPCPSNPDTAPGYTQYPWEGLQGAYAAAYMLYRLGYKDASGNNPFQINDRALLRAVQYQWNLQSKFGGSWYDSGRAAWVKHLSYVFYGFKPVQYDAADGGRNMTHTQWTIQKRPSS